MKQKSPLFIAFITIFLDLLGFGIIIPIQAFYAESFGASPAEVTWLGAAYSLMQFVFAPMWGRLSDRVGRKPIILLSVFVTAVGYLAFGLAGSLALLFAARLLSGFGAANLSTAQAIISDVTTKENRAKGMGLIGAAFGLGFIFGPAIGGLFGQISPEAPAFAAAGLSGLNFVFAWLFLPETLKKGERVPDTRHAFSLGRLRAAAARPNVGAIFVITGVYVSGFAMMEHTIGLLIEHTNVAVDQLSDSDRIKRAAELTAYFLVVVGVVSTIVQGGLIGRLSKRFGEVLLIRTGMALTACGLALMPVLIPYDYMLGLITAVMTATGAGISNPSLLSLLSLSAHDDEQGGTMGLNHSVSALGRVVGPAAAGPIYALDMTAMYFVAAACIAMGWLFSWRLRSPAES